MTPENKVKKQIMDFIAAAGVPRVLVHRSYAGQAGESEGYPDIRIECWHGHPVYIEVKAPGGRPSPAQIKWEVLLRSEEVGALYWRGSTIESFSEFWLVNFGNCEQNVNKV